MFCVILVCKFFWAGRGLKDEELFEARGTTLRGGLTGQAAEFAAGLDITEQLDFDNPLSNIITFCFP
jgi:hypothetical protein